jgi:hypothetical protein
METLEAYDCYGEAVQPDQLWLLGVSGQLQGRQTGITGSKGRQTDLNAAAVHVHA